MTAAREKLMTPDQVDPGLRRRVPIYALVFTVAVIVVVVHWLRLGARASIPVTVGLLGGLVLGVGASRMSRLRWDEPTGRVAGRIDALGAVILVLYVLLVVFRTTLLARWFAPSLVGVAGVATLAGLMLGQVVGTVGSIVRIASLVRPRSAERDGRRD